MIEVQPPQAGFTEVSVPVAINLDGLTFPEPGAYAFAIRVDGQDAERLSFGVDLTAQADGPQGLTSSRPSDRRRLPLDPLTRGRPCSGSPRPRSCSDPA